MFVLRAGIVLLTLFLACPQGALGQERPTEPLPAEEAQPEAEGAEGVEEPAPDEDAEYHTPLAGDPLKTKFLDYDVEIERRDRSATMALTLGGVGFTPNVGGNTFLPMGAFYWRQQWDNDRRLRAVISLFVNDIDFAEMFGGPEFLFQFENYTIPFESSEIVDGESLDETSLTWGTVDSWWGAGYRWRVPPWNVDNDLRIGAFYRAGWEYHERGEDMAPTSVVATDTYVHGFKFEFRLDAIQRNLLELPHFGMAAGFDLEFSRRDRWRDFGILGGIQGPGTPPVVFRKKDTRDFLRISGYLALALPIPGLSERHRFMAYAYAGYSPHGSVDRFSAFRLGGGPIPSETTDLSRTAMPGAVFDQFPVEDYFIATWEYRIEVLFFLYLHLRGSYASLSAPTFKDGGRFRFRRQETYIFSTALTSGFVWESQLYFEYDYDVRGAFRDEKTTDGHTFLLLWSKAF